MQLPAIVMTVLGAYVIKTYYYYESLYGTIKICEITNRQVALVCLCGL